MLSYAETCAVLSGAARFGIHPGLSTIEALNRGLGDPAARLRVIQIAGTNGKGSTARMLEALLLAHGETVGTFLSPHLSEYTEQVRVNGTDVSTEDFALGVTDVLAAVERIESSLPEPPTEFELVTAAALAILARAGVTWAILEAGMGGRWDSTSVAVPEVAVITSVALDHAEILGDTVEKIAAEKAAIIRRPARAAVLGPGTEETDNVFAARAGAEGVGISRVRVSVASGAREHHAAAGLTIVRLQEISSRVCEPSTVTIVTERGEYAGLAIPGAPYQAENAGCALAAAEAALERALDVDAARAALAHVANPGRFEVLAQDPLTIADGAHNPHGAAALADAVRHMIGEPVTLVVGVLADKDAADILAALVPLAAEVIATQPQSPRARDARELARCAADLGAPRVRVEPDVAQAIDLARKQGRPVVVAGSLRTVAEARARTCASPARGAQAT